MTTGIVLAGGHSRRFGERDKALATVAGEPMLARVASRVSDVTDDLVVSCRAEQRPAFDEVLGDVGVPVEYALDPVPSGGPLVGLRGALEGAGGQVVAVVACDMPAVDPAFLRYMMDQIDDHDAVVPLDRENERVPTQAVYRVGPTRAAARRQLEAGQDSLQGMLERLDVHAVPSAKVADRTDWLSLRDVDTPKSLRAMREALSG